VKYAWIDAQREFALAEMCAVLGVSVSGYRAWKRGGKPDRKRLADSQMLALIQAIHAELKGAYGSPRMVKALRARGFAASKDRVVSRGFQISPLMGIEFSPPGYASASSDLTRPALSFSLSRYELPRMLSVTA
jgi:hypothetical protein